MDTSFQVPTRLSCAVRNPVVMRIAISAFDIVNYLAPGTTPPNSTPLNINLNVACGSPRNVTSGPITKIFPAPTLASATATPPSRYCCPHAPPRGYPPRVKPGPSTFFLSSRAPGPGEYTP